MSESIDPLIEIKISDNLWFELGALVDTGNFGADDYKRLQKLVEEKLLDYYEKEDPSIYKYLCERVISLREIINQATSEIFY